ncbi:hypothetical protein E2562_033354 [Oryza meyeriana var. granulata]|uniref:Uncharacterized protein n=1 Tax=Oryza meyeriana var. granulata TaxID=110450 RepID=A0A6G1E6C2_9ORYZ|nr:hypothetical protein E2562_033354 [Oryza meyeriana var. granulata]
MLNPSRRLIICPSMDDAKEMRRVAAAATGSATPGEAHALAIHLQGWCRACLHLAALAFLACAFVQTAGRARARRDPWDLAFVVTAYAELAALFVVLRRAERLTPESPAQERRRLLRRAWALSTALSCTFAYRVARIMPAAMAVAVWAMTASVVAGGLYLLVLNDGHGSEDCHVVDDGKSAFHKIPADEMV